MPNGGRPSRELRIVLARGDGRIETVFTGLKGKFQFTVGLNGIHDYEAKLDPDAANVHPLPGGAYMQLKRPEEAERELLRAYSLGGAAVGNAQLLLYLSRQKLEPARRALEQNLKDVPAAPNAQEVREVIGKINEALKRN